MQLTHVKTPPPSYLVQPQNFIRYRSQWFCASALWSNLYVLYLLSKYSKKQFFFVKDKAWIIRFLCHFSELPHSPICLSHWFWIFRMVLSISDSVINQKWRCPISTLLTPIWMFNLFSTEKLHLSPNSRWFVLTCVLVYGQKQFIVKGLWGI